MEPNNTIESAGRTIRLSVILVTLGFCILFFWGVQKVFKLSTSDEPDQPSKKFAPFTPKTKPAAAPERTALKPPAIPLETAETGTALVKSSASVSTPVQPEQTNPLPATSPASQAVVRTGKQAEALKGANSIFGKVILEGKPPAELPLPLDPTCGKLNAGSKPTTQFYLVAKDGGLADVFVYISDGLPPGKYNPPDQPLTIDQAGCLYHPYIAGAMTGQMIEVINSDPVLHNVHPTPTTQGNKEYNKAHLPHAAPVVFKWDKPELFLRFKCDVHPWMFAYVSLLDHPFFAVTDAEGKFNIPNVPPGKYVVTMIHRKAGTLSFEITVLDGTNIALNARFQPAQ